jgi:hypothetical protein
LADELPFGQLSAGFIAFLLALIVVMAFVRSRSPVILVAVLLLVAVPLAGFTAYALVPGPPPDFGGWQLAVAAAGVVIASIGAVVMLGTATARRGPLSSSTSARLGIAMVALWVGIVIGISAFLAQWQPGFALANVVLNGAWAALWIPTSTRRLRSANSFLVRAPRSRVYQFIGRLENQALYDENVVSATADPPGDLVPGTKLTVIRRYDSGVRGPRMFPGTVEATSVVTELVADTSIILRGPVSASTFDFADSPEGTVVSTRVATTVPYRLAFLGAVPAILARRRSERAQRDRSIARLREQLEQP